jgi:DNA replication and repair protein RecF
VRIAHLSLVDFRSYRRVEVEFAPGVTAILGGNGQGKTNLLEAIGFTSRLQSFRHAPLDAVVHRDAERAIIRATTVRLSREQLVELELPRRGRARAMLNRQRVNRRSELLETFQVTVFGPDDLDLVKGPPVVRRTLLDEVVVACNPRADAVFSELERILRQRNALLRQVGGRPDATALRTLDIWDERLAGCGDRVGSLRSELVGQLRAPLEQAYGELAGENIGTTLHYEAPWLEEGLGASLERSRSDDLRRGTSTVGPHRDELRLSIGGRAARYEASQGEQRSLALALRLAAHRLIGDAVGSPPTLLLDDVFSELDHERSRRLLTALPQGQVVITSAVGVPDVTAVDSVLTVVDGSLREGSHYR